MNIDNFKIARGWVAEQEHFDMQDWIREPGGASWAVISEGEEFPCGTAACLAGTIALRTGETGFAEEIARRFLGLSQRGAMQLFSNPEQYDKVTLSDVTKDDVLAKLDEIIITGEFK